MGAFVSLLPKYESFSDAEDSYARRRLADQQVKTSAATEAETRQQTQNARLDQQIKQQAIDDEKALNQAWQKAAGDPSRVVDLAIRHGASPKAGIGLQGVIQSQRKAASEADAEALKLDGLRHDALVGKLQAYEQQPEEVRTAGWTPFLQQLHDSGLMKPEECQAFVQGHPQYPGADQMKVYENGLMTGSQITKQEMDRREAATKEATAAAATSNAATNAAKEKAAAEETAFQQASAALSTAAEQGPDAVQRV